MKRSNTPHKHNITAVLAILTLIFVSACSSQAEIETLKKDRATLINNNKLLANQLDEIKQQKNSLGSKLNNASDELSLKERELMAKSEALEISNRDLNLQNSRLEATIQELRSKSEALKQTEQQLQTASEKINKNRALYDNLVADLQGELASNQIKIKEMKDGINLNMAQDILFNSGSAKLNDSGKEVIAKVSQQLKDIAYSTVVTGFTDNIQISGNLSKFYPTNWELAGARAASVVTLLEVNGVSSDKLQAVSFGENKPVASNETAEGRSLNRRIEILLKPSS